MSSGAFLYCVIHLFISLIIIIVINDCIYLSFSIMAVRSVVANAGAETESVSE